MKIIIESVPHAQQRYDTLGDWWFDQDGVLQIRVSNDAPELPTAKHQLLVALHELVEVSLCQERGISQEAVDTFDMSPKAMARDGEPGDLPDAPYRREHRFAMLIEHLMAHELGLTGYGEVR